MFRLALSLVAATVFAACQAQPPDAMYDASVDYASGQIYVLQQPLFLVQADDTFSGRVVRTWLYLTEPGAAFRNLSDRDAMEKYKRSPSEFPEIKGILGSGTRLTFDRLAPTPILPLPLISPGNSTDVWLRVIDGPFSGSAVEAQSVSLEPSSGIWAKLNPAYLVAEKKAAVSPAREP